MSRLKLVGQVSTDLATFQGGSHRSWQGSRLSQISWPVWHGFAPRDRQLGLRASGALSPGLAEMSALAGAEISFTRAAALMAGLAGVTLSPRTVERSAEAAGAGRVDERQLTGLRAAQQIGIVGPSGRRQPW
jgi:hypothetical protein